VLPAEGILRAASRWLDLLGRSSYTETVALIGSESRYADLSPTQYATALEWLASLGILDLGPHGYRLSEEMATLHHDQRSGVAFARAVERSAPPWLPDSDVLVGSVDDLPEDASVLASALGVTPADALMGIRQVHGRIDLERRAEVGALGERRLVELLETLLPGSTTHIALNHDGFGYDIGFLDPEGRDWHLEVKSTTRRGRLVINLSRHEHDVAKLDALWRLVVVGLDESDCLACLATASHEALVSRAPSDSSVGARWQSARYELDSTDLELGLGFLDPGLKESDDSKLVSDGTVNAPSDFAWLPAD
jgi:hypothetical protein